MSARAAHLLAAWAAVALLALALPARSRAAPPAAYAAPMATIVGEGPITFRVTLGMLVDAAYNPVGIYRSYPSKSKVPLSEQYPLAMLTTRDGAILSSWEDLPLLVLHGRVAPRTGDYPLTLTYLTQVRPRRYARCALRVRYDGAHAWQLLDRAGRVLTEVTVTSSLTGIRSISACAPAADAAPRH
jgi:hypothetical protein